jgi:SAM-dependent methyltransferase
MNFYKKRAFQTEHLDYYNYIETLPYESYLDVGCANFAGIDLVNSKIDKPNKSFGVDIYKSHPKTIVCDLNKNKLPFKNNSIDVCSSFETIEHIFFTEHYIQEIYRVLKNNGILYISTPNLAWWVNRILLLFSYQPANTEVDLHHSMYGKPKIFKDNIGSGHIHIFTKNAMKEFLLYNKFKIIKIIPTNSKFQNKWLKLFNKIDYILSKIPSFAKGYIWICIKNE